MMDKENIILTMLKAVKDSSIYLSQIQLEIIDVEKKSDNSPVTIADKTSEKLLEENLKNTGIAFLGEETFNQINIPKNGSFFLADPLDGTREFIKPTDEFAVNLCWLENFEPHVGIIGIPKQNKMYFGIVNQGFYEINLENIDEIKSIEDLEKFRFIKSQNTIKAEVEKIVISHWEKPRNVDYLKEKFPNAVFTKLGSAIKFCEVAKGNADLYLRFSTVMEWDIAAGHALIQSAGGFVSPFLENKKIVYGKKEPFSGTFLTTSPYLNQNAIEILL
jgi:3'(2'), 5'-bisphosphate nucleotidase